MVDIAAVRAQLQEEELSRLAQKMQREGCAPDRIMGALWDANSCATTPLGEERLDALVAQCIDNYRKGYLPQLTKVAMGGFMEAMNRPGFLGGSNS